MALSLVISEIVNVKKYRNLEITVRGQSRSLKVVSVDTLDMVSYSNFVPKMQLFGDIRLQKCRDLENRVRGSVKVIEDVTIRQSAYDFLLMFQ